VLFRLLSQSFVRDYQRAQICTTIKEAIEYNEFDQVGGAGRKLQPDIIPAERNYVEDERQRLLQEIRRAIWEFILHPPELHHDVYKMAFHLVSGEMQRDKLLLALGEN